MKLRCLALLLLLLSTACSGKKILEESTLIRPSALDLVGPANQTLQISKGGIPSGRKYHVGFRVSEAFLNRAAARLLEAEVVPSKFENPVSMTIPPFGTKIAFRPSISVRDPRLVFTGSCADCIRVSSNFVGKLAVDFASSSSSSATQLFEGKALSGSLTLTGHLIPLYTGGIPSLGLQLEPIQSDDLSIDISIPIPGVDSLVTAAVQSQMIAAMSNPRLNTFPMLPVRALGVPGSKVAVNEIGYTLVAGPEGELFVGVLTNLKTAPEIGFEGRGRPLRKNDFAVLVGEQAMTDAMRVWMAEGLVPAVYDTSGNADPKGDVIIELKQLRLFEDHFESWARMWHVGKPPFWREFKLTGSLGVRSEAVTLRVDKAEEVDRAGPNSLIDLALKLYNVSLTKAIEGVGSRVPRQVGFPFGSPAKLTADVGVEEAQTDQKRATIFGGVNFSVPPPRGAKPAPPLPPGEKAPPPRP